VFDGQLSSGTVSSQQAGKSTSSWLTETPPMYNVHSLATQHAAHVSDVETVQTSPAPPAQVLLSPKFKSVVGPEKRSRSLLYGSRPGQPSVSELVSLGVSET
jgi:hypothetical protein